MIEILFVVLGIIFVVLTIKYIQAYGNSKYAKGRLDELEYQLEQLDRFFEECLQELKDRSK